MEYELKLVLRMRYDCDKLKESSRGIGYLKNQYPQ